jgi:hypothetical protein
MENIQAVEDSLQGSSGVVPMCQYKKYLSKLVNDENSDLLADSNTILNTWKSYYSQLLNIHDVSYIRQIEIHTAEP